MRKGYKSANIMPRKLGAVNIFEAAWLNRFLGDAREFRRLRKVEENFSEAGLPEGEIYLSKCLLERLVKT